MGELIKDESVRSKVTNRWVASLIAAAMGVGLAATGNWTIIWPAFGGANQMLAAIALMTSGLWVRNVLAVKGSHEVSRANPSSVPLANSYAGLHLVPYRCRAISASLRNSCNRAVACSNAAVRIWKSCSQRGSGSSMKDFINFLKGLALGFRSRSVEFIRIEERELENVFFLSFFLEAT